MFSTVNYVVVNNVVLSR